MSNNEKYVNIFGSMIAVTTMNSVLATLAQWINEEKTRYICLANVHTVVTGVSDQLFRKVTNHSAMTLPDGMPLVWLAKLKSRNQIQKCSGPDLMSRVFETSVCQNYSHFFYGDTEETLLRLKEKLGRQYPGLRIVEMRSPPFRPLTAEEDRQLIAEINCLKPDIIWVGLGAPKQELWMSDHVTKFHASLMIGVGAGFKFHAGTVSRAPVWMQNAGLEWFYRLAQEPRKLWKRYFVTNTLFIVLTLADLIKYILYSTLKYLTQKFNRVKNGL
jgi:N-acetylglucosaminyldiphosphoundecaprenol N-acetyl-beta-D-mannosaminyltransferase